MKELLQDFLVKPLLGIVLAIGLCVPVMAQNILPTLLPQSITVLLATNTVPATTTNTATTHRQFEVPTGSIVVLSATISMANPGTSNIVFGANGSVDGTYWTLTPAYSLTVTASGTNQVTSASKVETNCPYRYLSFDVINNPGTNALTIVQAAATFLPK